MEKKTSYNNITKEKIITAIKCVYDPEIPVDVYELGLIYDIQIKPINHVYIIMTLTSPNCPAAEIIPSQIETQVKTVEHVNEVKVDVVFDPPYDPSMMSEQAKLTLGFL